NQRAAYVLFGLELLALLAGGVAWWWRARSRRGAVIAVATVAVAVTLGGLLAFTTLGQVTLRRAIQLREIGDPYRVTGLSVSGRMFREEPWLGIGTGRFAGEFARYDPDPDMQWGSLSAHNLYAQFLAEGGAIGLACFLALVVAVVFGALRSLGTL